MSYLVEERHRDFLADPRCNEEYEMVEFVKKLGIHLHFLKKDKRFDQAIQGHPDIVGCPVLCTTLIDRLSYQNNSELLKPFRIQVVSSSLTSPYPYDSVFNAAVSSNFAIHGTKIEPALKEELQKRNIPSFVVRQGYAKCNIVVVDDRSIITSDKGIWKTCREKLNVLLVSAWKEIRLEGFDYGFLGGASLTRGDKIYFTGEIEYHPDFREIRKFLAERGKEAVSMRQGSLLDVGSFVPLYPK